jgi:DNA-binding Lrp family transcriptional regulator
MDIADTKRKILHLLQSNARTSNREIGDRLQMSETDVARLIAEMEQDCTIMGYHALVNQEALHDAPVRAIIEVEVQPERDGGFDRIARMVGRFAEVTDVYLVSGRYDLRLEVVGDSLQEVAFFVASKLAPLEGIRGTATHFLLKKYKEAGFALEKDEEYERLKVTP